MLERNVAVLVMVGVAAETGTDMFEVGRSLSVGWRSQAPVKPATNNDHHDNYIIKMGN